MSATENARNLANVLKFNDDLLMLSLTGMTDELARRRLRDGGPSVAWNLGHILYHRNQIAAAAGCGAHDRSDAVRRHRDGGTRVSGGAGGPEGGERVLAG